MNRLKHLSPFFLLSAVWLALASSISVVAQADELAIPVGQQGSDKAALEKPKTGMKADIVEKKFGAPLKKSTPVGKPPISIWEYPHFYVYFESDRVINTVLKPDSEEAPAASATPAPVAAPVPEVTPIAPTPTVTAAPAVVEPTAPAPAVEATPSPAPVTPAAVEPTPAAAPVPESAPPAATMDTPPASSDEKADTTSKAADEAAPETTDANKTEPDTTARDQDKADANDKADASDKADAKETDEADEKSADNTK